MARTRDRVLASFFVITFIFGTFAFAAYVIYDEFISDEPVNNGAATSQQTTANPTQQEETVNPNALQGKPLANFTPVADIPTLQKQDITPGTGEEVKSSDTITVDYTGALASTGIVFESSLDAGTPATFPLSGVIPGWTQGVPGTKVGGTVRLLIPSALAYGSRASDKIPADSDLVFDITVKAIVKQ